MSDMETTSDYPMGSGYGLQQTHHPIPTQAALRYYDLADATRLLERDTFATDQPDRHIGSIAISDTFVPSITTHPIAPGGRTEPINVTITGDNELQIGGASINLDADSLFILEALKLYRGNPIRAEKILNLGFRPELDNTRHARLIGGVIRSLREKLHKAAGKDLIIRSKGGRNTLYALHPDIVLLDERPIATAGSGNTSLSPTPMRRSKTSPQQTDHTLVRSEQVDELTKSASPDATDAVSDRRNEVMGAVVKSYSNHPRVQRALYKRRTSNETSLPRDASMLDVLMSNAIAYPLLSHEEETEFFASIERGLVVYGDVQSLERITADQEEALIKLTEARQILYHSNLRLVINIAKHYWGKDYTAMGAADIVQEGNIGLLRSIAKFDLSRGYKFSTHAIWWIRQAITRGIAEKQHMIRIPETYGTMLGKATKIIHASTLRLGRNLTNAEITQEIGMDAEEYFQSMRIITGTMSSLDVQCADEDSTLKDFIPDMNATLDQVEMRESLRSTAHKILRESELSDFQKFVIGLWCGIGADVMGPLEFVYRKKAYNYGDYANGEEMTYVDIGNKMGVSRETIRQLGVKGIQILRADSSYYRRLV